MTEQARRMSAKVVDWNSGVFKTPGLTPATLRAAADIARSYGGEGWEATADRLLAKAADLEEDAPND